MEELLFISGLLYILFALVVISSIIAAICYVCCGVCIAKVAPAGRNVTDRELDTLGVPRNQRSRLYSPSLTSRAEDFSTLLWADWWILIPLLKIKHIIFLCLELSQMNTNRQIGFSWMCFVYTKEMYSLMGVILL